MPKEDLYQFVERILAERGLDLNDMLDRFREFVDDQGLAEKFKAWLVMRLDKLANQQDTLIENWLANGRDDPMDNANWEPEVEDPDAWDRDRERSNTKGTDDAG